MKSQGKTSRQYKKGRGNHDIIPDRSAWHHIGALHYRPFCREASITTLQITACHIGTNAEKFDSFSFWGNHAILALLVAVDAQIIDPGMLFARLTRH